MLSKRNQAFTGRKSQKTRSKRLQVNFHHHCDSVGTVALVTQAPLLYRATAKGQIRDLRHPSSPVPPRTPSSHDFQPPARFAKYRRVPAAPSPYTLNPRKCTFQMKVYLTSFYFQTTDYLSPGHQSKSPSTLATTITCGLLNSRSRRHISDWHDHCNEATRDEIRSQQNISRSRTNERDNHPQRPSDR